MYAYVFFFFWNRNKSLQSFDARVKLQVIRAYEIEWAKEERKKKEVFNLGDSWYYKLWVEPCTTVLLFASVFSSTMHFLYGTDVYAATKHEPTSTLMLGVFWDTHRKITTESDLQWDV